MEKITIDLEELTKNLQKTLNFKFNEFDISYFSGYKASDYYVPQMVFSTKQALNPRLHELAWFCEIFVNGMCIFREKLIKVDESSDKELEQKVLKKLVQSIFNYGIMGSRESLLKFNKERYGEDNEY